MKLTLRRDADRIELIANSSIRVYYNTDIEKVLAWAKLNFKLSDKELTKLRQEDVS